DVLVRDIGARDRDGLVVLHLLRELARDLDGLHARLEGAAEGALEESLELRFQVAEDAHGPAILGAATGDGARPDPATATASEGPSSAPAQRPRASGHDSACASPLCAA